MLSRGFRTSKKQKMWAAALNTQKYICMRVSGLILEHNFHSSLITVCRVVSCCTGVVSPSDGSARGEKDAHMFIVHFCQPLHLRSDNDSFWLSDKSVVMNKGTFELLIILKSRSWTEPQPWHMCFCYINYMILFNENQFVLRCSFVRLLCPMWRERGRLNLRFLSCGIWRRWILLLGTVVAEKLAASIFRVE
jgi:hypothetical protein